ncbi:TIGR03085 family metal-binding protein [Millisia brevis]|uniref:TIGR03085 family metal-binding protein n=1 Tax=Millisia brevis TaxID=264148 RepID=UPI000833C7A5|nr:TIGR03085 family metal-binding protein [Millisia brevis]
MNVAQYERRELVSTLRSVGPDAPTLCEGWTTRDLAAHLVVRERDPIASVGILVTPLAGYTRKVQDSVAERPWEKLLADVESGPPWYSPLKPVDRWVNAGEMFIHHEDVLRGGADPEAPWTPRDLPAGQQEALETPVTMMGRMLLRDAPVRVTLRSDAGTEILTAGTGNPVNVTGTPGELLLFVAGRLPVRVTYSGEPADVAALGAMQRGL